MPRGKITDMQDAEALILGCLILGTGGGGRAERGLQLIREALKEGLTLSWVDAEEISDEALTVQPYSMGSVAPITQAALDEIKRTNLVETHALNSMVEAVKELGTYLGKPVGCIVPSEPGASNMPEPLVVGARLGIPVVDGDYAGRCIPEEMQTTPFLTGKRSDPFTSVDPWGDVVICERTQNSHMLERIGKMLAVAAYGHTSMASTALSGREMKAIVVRGTITRAMEIGQAISQARRNKQNPMEAAILSLNKTQEVVAWQLFGGQVERKDWEDRDGYMYGNILVKGTGRYTGHELKVWFKNENHISWLDGKPFVCSPDLLTLVYEDGEGCSNSTVKEGDKVTAIGIKGVEDFRTEFGLNHASGPRYFGFDIDYVPIEEMVKRLW
jgi:DUF917 family protein